MTESEATDAANYARRHAGEQDPGLSPEQRDLLGRVIAKRIERGEKLRLIARAVAHALPELGDERARRLGRDEALRALAWERLAALRAGGETQVALSPAHDACPTCRGLAGAYALSEAPPLPVAGCTQVGGCRCLYRSLADAALDTAPALTATHDAVASPPHHDEGSAGEMADSTTTPPRPWYRPRSPRPHGPRWQDAERSAPESKARPHARGSGPRRPERGDA